MTTLIVWSYIILEDFLSSADDYIVFMYVNKSENCACQYTHIGI